MHSGTIILPLLPYFVTVLPAVLSNFSVHSGTVILPLLPFFVTVLSNFYVKKVLAKF